MILMTRVFAASLGLALAACGADTRLRLNEDPAKRGKDEMAITSHDGKMVLAVRLDSIRMRLSDSARKAATADIATNTTDTSGGVGAWIASKAGEFATKGVGLEASVAISSVASVEVKDSSVKLVMKGGRSVAFGGGDKGRAKGEFGAFAPADAERFAAYLRPRLTN